ncbi:adenylate/guanylate cyclase domain-containing protein [Yoonia sp.]|uniref:ATP-binding protein n=1 Tax=Yoonia sp. TaxID=2212373 RepID=UPI0025F8CF99|nr:adenylate/guanylate cyclase domain-containing protein [Yoonia sp.]
MNTPHIPSALTGRGERKQITAVFIDLVGFSDIASTADAEDLQQWLEDYYTQSRDIIEAHDGEVTEYLGDGVVALFGLSKADELAAAKAVNAALKAVNEISAAYRGGVSIEVRAGVATGEVAVRASSGNNTLPRATGMVTTLAQRIQERATAGTVMVSERTRMLLRDTMVLQEMPGQRLKGFAEAQTLYQPMPQAFPLQRKKLDFFVGRKTELQRITASREPCLLIGQAGIGKTTLSRFVAQSAAAVSTFAADGTQTRASYQPFNDWIMQQTGSTLPEFSDIQTRFGALEPDAQRALALALGLPEGQRLLAERTNLALKSLIDNSLWQAIQAVQPDGLLIFEDLHWLDNASFSVLVNILLSPAAANYQIVMTSREDTKIGKYLGNLPIVVIPLETFDDADAQGMLDALSEGKVTANERAALVEKAGGVPLYLEQLYKRRATGTQATDHIPGSLMDLLAEQIDATGPSKPVLQCAAVIGRSFSLDMLRAIAADQEPLDTHLHAACTRGVLLKDAADAWTFSHALLHQAAYQGMLRKTRIEYHGQIADHLQERHPDAVRRNPALLTDHLSRAQQYVPAIQNYLTVSQWALFQGALEDAEAHIIAALTLCADAPGDIDVTDLEIACQTALGSIRMQTQGFTAAPVKEAFEAVERLATAQHKYSSANGPAFYGSFSHAIISADKAGSERFCNLLVETADNLPQDAASQQIRLAALGTSVCLNFYSGNFQEQFQDFAGLRAIYDVGKHGAMIAQYGMDTFAAAQMFEPVGRAICGDSHLVDALSAETDTHQDQLNIPVMLPYAQVWGAVPLFYAGKTDQAIARLQQGIATAHAQAALFWQITGSAWLHVMDPTQSDTPEGLAQFEQILLTHEAIGSNVGLPYFRAYYAQALWRHAKPEMAYKCARQATGDCAASGLLCWYPEVLRLHADICDKTHRSDEATKALSLAVSIADQQHASLWRLRARLDQFATGRANGSDLAAALAAFPTAATPPEVIAARALLETA